MTKKSSSSSRGEFSIPGDELERHRIQLERDLQNTDLSLHLSSVQDDTQSLEYPRHGSAPEHFTAFASFDQHSRDDLELDPSRIRAWSIHDDEGIAPYDARTMSTAAHHASAVTITAGLARSGKRDRSISGAEYDPERPLQDILAACHRGSDAADAERSQDIARPKLSETLQRTGFSPRRPRVPNQPRASQHGPSDSPQIPRRNMTPRARKPTVTFKPVTGNPPNVSVQPPTPSTSQFTKMAKGLVRDVRQALEEEAIRAASSRNRLHLPDVTGLTNAVVSPAKANLDRYPVRSPGSQEVEGRLIASLNALHSKLNHLETENSVARRRVRELEYELEECKRDVIRERTRIIETEGAVGNDAHITTSTSRAKGKEKKSKDDPPSRYFEIVEEKKALEALVTTLRSHLTRVTSDLSAQQQLLEELRRLRESDALSLSEKAQEISVLRTEVERLAGEIEVLRGVVEEGLNERRQGRQTAASQQGDHDELAPADESPVQSIRRFIDDDEVDRISEDLDERRSERASNSSAQSSVSPPAESNPPFPKISTERMERLFFCAPRHNSTSCQTCKGHHHRRETRAPPVDRLESAGEGFSEVVEPPPRPDKACEPSRGRTHAIEDILERLDRNGGTLIPGDVPPQTVLARVIGELEEEFAHFREIYTSLTAEYKSLDCATQTAKRQVVHDRVRDVIEVLELKGNQIASLYDLLVFKDKPIQQ